jgi:cellulose biosynthesis protein BcsQ
MVAPSWLELDAIARMREHVELMREEVLLHSQQPVISGILSTMADPYSITQDTLLRIEQSDPGDLLKTIIPKNNDLQKAIGRACSIFEIAPESSLECRFAYSGRQAVTPQAAGGPNHGS